MPIVRSLVIAGLAIAWGPSRRARQLPETEIAPERTRCWTPDRSPPSAL